MEMKKEKLLALGIDLLRNLDVRDVETIQINTTKYDDESESLSIEISYPVPRKEASNESHFWH